MSSKTDFDRNLKVFKSDTESDSAALANLATQTSTNGDEWATLNKALLGCATPPS